MIMAINVDIGCNVCGSWERVQQPTYSLASARRKLRAKGWTSTQSEEGPRGDLCPTCRFVRDKKLKVAAAERERLRSSKL